MNPQSMARQRVRGKTEPRTVPRGARAASWLLIAMVTVAGFFFGCRGTLPSAGPPVLRLAVTTSTRDSGLLDLLVPMFEEQENVRVDVIAVGTGAALKLGESGDVDVVLVHARPSEDAFLAAGHGVRREDVMVNSFVILGPPEDPAEASRMSPAGALAAVAATGHRFVSRGDNSGTHQRELQLWQRLGGRPDWNGYVESGQGMGATLTMAEQMQGYVLSDRGTYLNFKSKIQLVPLVTDHESLRNPYGVLVVDPDKNEPIQGQLAQAFVDFLISRPAQEVIRDYRVDGEPLFLPRHLPQD